MLSPPIRLALATSLCLWVLLAHVYAHFTPVREKIVREPQPGRQRVSVVLPGGDAWTDAQLVAVCVVRNDGPTRMELAVSAGGEVRRRVHVAPGSTLRIDIAWPRPARWPDTYSVDLTSSSPAWTLKYFELANLHGFTRGAVDLLVLPAGQGFGHAPAWWVAVFGAGVLLLSAVRVAPWPPWVRIPWLVLAVVIAATFIVVVVSPFVSPFRVVLSPGTFALGALVLAGPRAAALGLLAWRPSAFVIYRLKGVPWAPLLAGVGVAAYALFLVSRVGAYAAGADSSGYLNNARLLSQGRATTPMRLVAGIPPADLPRLAYVPLGFRPRGDHEMAPVYPIGLPLALAATARLTGWERAPSVTMVCHALLGVLLMYGLGRVVGLSRGWAALGTLLVATSPQYLFSSLSLMSDTPAMVWTTAAVLLAWRSRGDTRWALLAGAALAFAVLVRPTNALIVAPVAVCLGASLSRWAWLGAGGLPGAALLLLYNLSAYGGAFESGYGNAGSLFRLAHVPLSLRNYAAWLPVALTPLVLLAAFLPLLWRRSARCVSMLVLWIAPLAVVYAFYYHTHETWWYLRFLLPIFPPLVAGALLVGRALFDRWTRTLSPAAARNAAVLGGLVVATAVVAHNVMWNGRLHASESGRGERVYVEMADWARTHLPPGSALAAMQASGALFHYTDFALLRWSAFNRRTFRPVVAALERRRQPLYAVVFQFEVEEKRVFTDHVPGQWTLVGSVGNGTFWRFDGPLAGGRR